MVATTEDKDKVTIMLSGTVLDPETITVEEWLEYTKLTLRKVCLNYLRGFQELPALLKSVRSKQPPCYDHCDAETVPTIYYQKPGSKTVYLHCSRLSTDWMENGELIEQILVLTRNAEFFIVTTRWGPAVNGKGEKWLYAKHISVTPTNLVKIIKTRAQPTADDMNPRCVGLDIQHRLYWALDKLTKELEEQLIDTVEARLQCRERIQRLGSAPWAFGE